jgi:hypothetical protein
VSERTKLRWSFASAVALSLITLFVFLVFQNFGPESAVRRLHAVTYRIADYIPREEAFDLQLVKLSDLAELRAVTLANDPQALKGLIEILRISAYTRARYEIVRLDYQTPSLVVAVVQYNQPGAEEPQFFVWIVKLDGRTWKIDPAATVKLMSTR